MPKVIMQELGVVDHLVAGREEFLDGEANLGHPILKLRLDGSRDFASIGLRAYHLHRPDLRYKRPAVQEARATRALVSQLSVVKRELWGC
eukprot:scaffold122038_cov64-Phaeocystis_antarctica.AAC.5